MQTEIINIDLSVFDSIEFDPHKKARKCKRLIQLISNNQPDPLNQPWFKKNALRARVLSKENQENVLAYANFLVKRMKRGEIRFTSIEKNLSEAWVFCLGLNELNARNASKQDIENWWNAQLIRLENKEIAHATLDKLVTCLIAFFQFLECSPPKKRPERLAWIQMPKRPKPKLEEAQPTQVQIKQLVQAVFEEGKESRYSLRDQSIIALLNDTGARIGEVLSMRNKHVREEENYLVVSFPESKSTPRTVISLLAKPYLEKWAKVSPNRTAGPDAFFFCDKKGGPVTYAALLKSFKKAVKRTGIPWKQGKSVHYLRSIASSRFYEWPYNAKLYWFGWSNRSSEERTYTRIGYEQCKESYLNTLRKENNPFLEEETPFWQNQKIDEMVIAKLLEKDEFRVMLRQMVRQSKG